MDMNILNPLKSNDKSKRTKIRQLIHYKFDSMVGPVWNGRNRFTRKRKKMFCQIRKVQKFYGTLMVYFKKYIKTLGLFYISRIWSG